MEEYAFSSCSGSYNSGSQDQEVIRKVKQTPSFLTSLHSTHKDPTKLLMKKPTAPFPPTPARIYKVDPLNFREVVQMLTGGPPPEVAALPLGILATRTVDVPPKRSNPVVYPSVKMPWPFEQVVCDDHIGQTVVEGSARNQLDDFGGLSFSLSSLAWSSSLLPSHRSMSSLAPTKL